MSNAPLIAELLPKSSTSSNHLSILTNRVVLVPAIHTDFAVLHVQKSTANGITRIEGQTFADVQQALCADTVIVTAEEIVEEEVLRQKSEGTSLPYFVVKHVCHVPFGSHPYAVFQLLRL